MHGALLSNSPQICSYSMDIATLQWPGMYVAELSAIVELSQIPQLIT